VSEPGLKYCPVCASPLVEKYIFDAQRLTCSKCDFIFFLNPKLVAVVVISFEGKLLLGKRNINPGKGKWSFVSGYIDRGESVEDAAIREVKEETNLDVHLEKLIGVYSANGNPNVLIVYEASIVNDEISCLTTQDEEVSELTFFSLEELPELAFPFDYQILADWKDQANHP
jgi:8-oxo-dGTP diphosphatase